MEKIKPDVNSLFPVVLLKTLPWIAWLLLICAFAMFFAASFLFPMCSDDFSYSFIWGKYERVQGIGDVIVSQTNHYFTWGGRFFTHCVVQIMLLYDKFFFAVANVMAYCVCSYMICKLSMRSYSIWMQLIIAMTLWCLMPAPGTSMFWQTGSVNYLWAISLNVIFIYLLLSGRKCFLPLAVIFACIAGNAHEGISCGVFVLGLFLFFIRRRNIKYQIVIMAAYALGFLLNALAPGNFVRLDTMPSLPLCAKLYINTKNLLFNFLLMYELGLRLAICMFAVNLMIFVRFWLSCRKKALIVGAFLISSIAAISLNIYTGAVYPRALFSFCFISYIGFVVSISLFIKPRFRKMAIIFSLCAAFVLNISEVPKVYTAIKAMREISSLINEKIHSGEQVIIRPESFEKADGRYIENWGLSHDVIQNRPRSRYYQKPDFVVLSTKEKEIYGQLVASGMGMETNVIARIQDNYYITRLSFKPKRINLTQPPPLDSPYVLAVVREGVKKTIRRVHPAVIPAGEDYFVLWQSEEKDFSMRVQAMDGTWVDIKSEVQ